MPISGMRVEREVVRRKRDVGLEERLQPPLHRAVDDPRVGVPEQPVVDDHELRVQLSGALEQLERARDRCGDLRDLVGADDLQAHRSVVVEGIQVE